MGIRVKIRGSNNRKSLSQSKNNRQSGNYKKTPFFFTKEKSTINLIDQYKGSSIFVVCNGPSLNNFNLSLLKKPGVMTYGMNNGVKTVRPNLWSCVDEPKRFMKSIWLDPCITKFVPNKHSDKTIFDNEKWEEMNVTVGECPNVIFYRRNDKFVAEDFLFENTINWGNHAKYGGCRSVMLPIIKICFLLGFRTIYLLGADFKMSQTYTYHFDEQRAKGPVKCNTKTYDRLKSEYFPQIKPYLEKEGMRIYNCNENSELKVFDYMPFSEAIEQATCKLGDVENERTWGLYSKKDDKPKWKIVPDDKNTTMEETEEIKKDQTTNIGINSSRTIITISEDKNTLEKKVSLKQVIKPVPKKLNKNYVPPTKESIKRKHANFIKQIKKNSEDKK